MRTQPLVNVLHDLFKFADEHLDEANNTGQLIEMFIQAQIDLRSNHEQTNDIRTN
jgi:hypothetical protein